MRDRAIYNSTPCHHVAECPQWSVTHAVIVVWRQGRRYKTTSWVMGDGCVGRGKTARRDDCMACLLLADAAAAAAM